MIIVYIFSSLGVIASPLLEALPEWQRFEWKREAWLIAPLVGQLSWLALVYIGVMSSPGGKADYDFDIAVASGVLCYFFGQLAFAVQKLLRKVKR